VTAPTVDTWAVVARAQSGDADAFAELYERYRDTVFRFVYFRVGSRPLAEDLAQEVWVRALRRIGSVQYQGLDIAAWLITVARHLTADHYKSGRYRLEVLTGDVLGADDPASDDPAASTANYLDARVLMAAIQRLGDEQRRCLELRFLRGYSTEETAQQMGKTYMAVKTLQYRAVRALARDEDVQRLVVQP
jgi:RNA polymerase sigma-70 factor (ECF subfamily)